MPYFALLAFLIGPLVLVSIGPVGHAGRVRQVLRLRRLRHHPQGQPRHGACYCTFISALLQSVPLMGRRISLPGSLSLPSLSPSLPPALPDVRTSRCPRRCLWRTWTRATSRLLTPRYAFTWASRTAAGHSSRVQPSVVAHSSLPWSFFLLLLCSVVRVVSTPSRSRCLGLPGIVVCRRRQQGEGHRADRTLHVHRHRPGHRRGTLNNRYAMRGCVVALGGACKGLGL